MPNLVCPHSYLSNVFYSIAHKMPGIKDCEVPVSVVHIYLEEVSAFSDRYKVI